MPHRLIREELQKYRDSEYAAFHARLTPTRYEIIGVKIPTLRRIAKNLPKPLVEDYLRAPLVENYECVMLWGLLIARLPCKDEAQAQRVRAELERFLPYVENWAICDVLCGDLKAFASSAQGYAMAQAYASMESQPFSQRFGLVMLLHFIDSAHISRVLELARSVRSEHYYVRMACAWLLSVCYVKFPFQTLSLLKSHTLQDEILSLTIRKIGESRRVSAEQKAQIRALKPNKNIKSRAKT